MNILLFIIGLVFGSFFNVCIFRIPLKQSISYPPSHCSSCDNKLKSYDLIPVVSYILLGGKCRYCRQNISLQYPIVEVITGFAFLISYIVFGYSLVTIQSIILMSLIIIMSFIDLEHYIIPDSIVIITIIVGIVFNLLTMNLSIFSMIGGFLIGGIFLLLITLVGPMGGGDIKIMAAFGLFLGIKGTLLALLLSFIYGGVIGVLLIVFKIKGRKEYIPFGPFLGLGTLSAFLFSEEIITWYITLLSR